jgi:hypothetical protein
MNVMYVRALTTAPQLNWWMVFGACLAMLQVLSSGEGVLLVLISITNICWAPSAFFHQVGVRGVSFTLSCNNATSA